MESYSTSRIIYLEKKQDSVEQAWVQYTGKIPIYFLVSQRVTGRILSDIWIDCLGYISASEKLLMFFLCQCLHFFLLCESEAHLQCSTKQDM